jgi:hypothetical protein
MALALYDRVQQTGTANTTVSFTLTGSVSGYQSFSVVGNGNTTFYGATDTNGNWEVGIGTYATGGTLTRTTVLSSSNSGSAVTFSGTVTVFVTYPSERSVNLDGSGNVSALGTISSGTWQGSTVGVAYGGTGVTTSSSTSANSVVLRDASVNVTANNFIAGYNVITASGGTTVLTVASAYYQRISGSTTQTIQLPIATTMANGQGFTFDNDSSGTVTIVDSASATIDTIPSGGYGYIFVEDNTTSAGSWGKYALLPATYDFNTTTANFGNATITNATWNGTAIASGYGGTGLTTFTAANYALYSTSASALTAGTLPVAAGGTGATTLTSNGVVYGTGTTAVGVTAAGTTGQVLVGNTGAAPSWATVSSSLVSSFSAGTTGFTPSSATTGAVTLAGTLNVVNGGTGLTTLTANYIPYGNGTSALASSSNLTYNNSTGALTAPEHVASNGIFVNNQTIGTSYSIPSGYSASSVGPISIASGITVTVGSGSRWVVL